jgi:hypothetical protein
VLYQQCRFRRGSERRLAWIDARAAKVGAWIDLESADKGGPWRLEAVLDAPRAGSPFAGLLRINRTPLSAMMRNIV